jgi:uncharacterized membrane protein
MHFILEIYIWIVFVWRVMQISSSIVSASKKNCVLRAKPKILYEFWRVMQISSSIVLASKKIVFLHSEPGPRFCEALHKT